ncbi:p-aminobenzoyl-glutamate transport protein [Photobacterium damselae subsp. piscicida]|uniref:AbgT family transporter n=1 Tax=Photobacterium damsela subsp. piscicida TaxID=38294 RepID=A0A1V1V9A1_PHODP|nr:AbgT family transporter [Photobacterium damselae]MBE8129909.1 AbgT family transporter [Photobacterium damselae subsp. piscicida]PSV76158.1 aminobenzoyl-glutamate transporter [Photobacterium damselae]QOD52100.1 AbgT family transporter [Photobacterium damselae subsp. piscicida]QOD55954.1 AbgT family transporter [Photobacterium damselae subsp. piscicida]BAX52151.1 p-aminobenzoyl-glutamate transport protein [Photobacterium damselae subsp. piscicida]
MSNQAVKQAPEAPSSAMDKFLNGIERVGNKIPDPALLFFWGLVLVWVLSAVLSQFDFGLVHPVTQQSVEIKNLLTGESMASFLANMVKNFTGFAPLGIVLVAMLGVGVAEASGFINTGLKKMLNVTPVKFLTPMLILVAIVSHTAADAGYVLVIPLGGIIFHAAGRHPLAGIAAAFAGVSGGFSANFIPSGIDPLLAGFTQEAARIMDPDYIVNPLANIIFTGLSSFVIVAIGWYITDKIIEPRLAKTAIDDDAEEAPDMGSFTELESKAFSRAGWAMVAGIALLVAVLIPETSPLRSLSGEIAAFNAPVMQSIVPLIFILFVIPGIIYGKVAGTFKESQDVIKAMSTTMAGMAGFMVMVFFIAQFLVAFTQSNIGTLLALSGAKLLQEMNLPGQITIIGMILLTASVNLLVGSASAKWALIGPIMVPMLMAVGISPELTQAAYRVGDSVSNIISPMMVFFPLVVVYMQRYVKSSGIGTLASMMMPYSIVMLVGWTIFLLVYWAIGIPLGVQAPYTYTIQ